MLSTRRARGTRGLLWLLIAGSALVGGLLVSQFIVAARQTDPYSVSYGSGVVAQKDPDAIADLARQLLATMGSRSGESRIAINIESVQALMPIQVGREIDTSMDNEEPTRTLWLIKARGPFYFERVPLGVQPAVVDHGYILVDDATGEIIGLGTLPPE